MISNDFVRERAPVRNRTVERGTRSALANVRAPSSVARPAAGAERTRTTMPSAPTSTTLLPDRGVTRTVMVLMSACSMPGHGRR